MINLHHNIQYCDQVFSFEQILEQYEINKSHILDLIKNNPQNLVYLWKHYLCADYYCQNLQLCSSCETLSHIQNEKQINIPFKSKNNYMILIKNNIQKPYIKLVDNKMKGDIFTIKLLITWILEKTLNENILKLHTGFICQHDGYLLYDIPVINEELCPFDRLIEYKYTKEIVYGLLTQVIVLFHQLTSFEFSMGRPYQNSLLFDKTPYYKEYIYNNLKYKIQCDYTIKLSDLTNSSLKYHHILFFPENCIHEMIYNHFNAPFKQNDNTFTINLNQFDANKIILPQSIDLYLMILSMMSHDNFFNTVMENQDCYDLWKSLWVDQESIIEERLIEMNENTQLHTLLKDIQLYIDPYKNAFNYMNMV